MMIVRPLRRVVASATMTALAVSFAAPVGARPVDPTPVALQAGVVGVLESGDSDPLIDTPVQAFAEWNGIVFVGGKFAQVQRADGSLHAQSYLAAFDRRTGAWIDSFRPRLDGTVYELTVAGGRLFVGGQFTSVNGAAGTAGLAALDPATGLPVSGWRASLGLTGSTQRPFVRAMDVDGSWLYVGGNFSRLTGPDGVVRSRGRLAKVALSNGLPDAAFTPDVGGTVVDLDATVERIWIAGTFTTVNRTARSMVGAVTRGTGALIPMRATVQTSVNSRAWFRQGVLQVGDQVWVAGSQHSTQVYRASDLTLLRQWISDPFGDGQTLAVADGVVYGGSHANERTWMHADATLWPGVPGSTHRDPVRWIGAWDIATRSFIGSWQPRVSTAYGEGAWELFVDSARCVWAGGDFNRATDAAGRSRFAQGFVKFCPSDASPPRTPQNLSGVVVPGGDVRLTWTASVDDVGVAGYIVLRNGVERLRVSGPSATVAGLGRGTHYMQVQAFDAAGNLSRRTPSAVIVIR